MIAERSGGHRTLVSGENAVLDLPVWAGEGQLGGVAGHRPPALVDEVVMVMTEQDQFVEVGEPAPGGEFSKVVRLAPAGRAIALRAPAPTVTSDEGEELLG